MSARACILPGGREVLPAASPARLQLTSLVDMMVILVVFLLQSFAVEGQLVTPAADIDLPNSSVDAPVRRGPVIEVGTGGLRVDGRDVAAAPTGGADPEALDRALARLDTSGPVVVQCDRRVDFRVLGGVLRACGRRGLDDVSLLVLGDGR